MKLRIAKRQPEETRRKIVEATVALILRQGFTGASVGDICAQAGVTKGSFFHHFRDKEAAGLAAADWWGAMGTSLYAAAWAEADVDPLDQLHRFFDIMIGFSPDEGQACTCVVGILSQEMALISPALRERCSLHLEDWTRHVVRMLEAAKKKHPPLRDFDAEQIGWVLNSLWQGSMLIGKARQSPGMIRANLQFARDWVMSLFAAQEPPGTGLHHSPIH